MTPPAMGHLKKQVFEIEFGATYSVKQASR